MSSTGLCTLTFLAEDVEGNTSESEPKTNVVDKKEHRDNDKINTKPIINCDW